MTTINFLPRTDDMRDTWLAHFAGALPNYANKYKITDTELKLVADAALWFSAILSYAEGLGTFANTVTAFKNALRDGLPSGATLSSLVPPALAMPETAAMPGIFAFVTALAARIKKTAGYSDVDGRDLGIEGNPAPGPDPTTLTPTLRTALGSGGHPELKWAKQHMGMLEIQVDRGEGHGWEPLAVSNQARYIDTHALPAAGATAVWKYRAIYLDHDHRFGQWSAVALATVMG